MKMHLAYSAAGALCAALMILAGCSGRIEESKQVARAYIKSFDTKDPEYIKSFYTPEARQFVDTSDFINNSLLMHERLGQYESLQVAGIMENRRVGDGAYMQIAFKVYYANYQTTELVVLTPTGPGDSMKVVNHQVTPPPGFVGDILKGGI